ncbi:hypothetical protein MSAN_02104000 [Mycena sanguinolenta]|uniref:Uncharacterized protein n=1 Tax=Mycena sanguinolenta TaxID=230812 RepID=A0A8H6XFZ3_9AGAR|nr:hypothetical protein MSAN_02104000 [Mycena sanguinolenta]
MPASDKPLMSASFKPGKSLFDWPQSTSPAPFPLLIFSGYLSTIPVLNFLSSPTGPVSQVLTPLLSKALHCASKGMSSIEESPQKAVALLTLFYVFTVFILSAIMSVTGQLLGSGEGYKNKEPRMNKRTVSNGLPHRMIATHEALYDTFPDVRHRRRPLCLYVIHTLYAISVDFTECADLARLPQALCLCAVLPARHRSH